jgi:hypothetical protein
MRKDEELAKKLSQLDNNSNNTLKQLATSSSASLAVYLLDLVSRALSGWISLDCVCYLWDQGFLFGNDTFFDDTTA